MRVMEISECLFYMQSNFPGFDKTVKNIFPNPQVVDEVKYKDEDLMIDGKRCFEKIEKLEGLKFFAEFFKSERCSHS